MRLFMYTRRSSAYIQSVISDLHDGVIIIFSLTIYLHGAAFDLNNDAFVLADPTNIQVVIDYISKISLCVFEINC